MNARDSQRSPAYALRAGLLSLWAVAAVAVRTIVRVVPRLLEPLASHAIFARSCFCEIRVDCSVIGHVFIEL
jgi:hypothetical protein